MNSMTAIAALLAAVLVLTSSSAAADEANTRRNMTEEMQLINKSLEDLLSELALIKREAVGRLSQAKSQPIDQQLITSEQRSERIRQTKVSRFVLKRVAELESESQGMRDELAKLFDKPKALASPSAEAKQEDHDFDEQQSASSPASSDSTTTLKPEELSAEEAAKLGFDMEALKKLGEEIGKRLDQFGKDAAKNLADLLEGVKLVFREPAKQPARKDASRPSTGAELESEMEARQQQTPESLRGVHEQVIRLVDNMVQNYLGNVRRTIQRMNNLIDRQRSQLVGSQPRQQAADSGVDSRPDTQVAATRESIQHLSTRMNEFSSQWARATSRQQSPLLDRIPFRGMDLWQDFWLTVRKQVRRINEEFWQLSQDMSRMLTGRLPNRPRTPSQPSLLYAPLNSDQVQNRFQEFYDKMSVTLGEQQQKIDRIAHGAQQPAAGNNKYDQVNLIDEQDDQQTKDELTRNVALRQQIQQEISIFGSIFDIMRTFIQRLRESTTNAVRDVIQPGASNNNNNDPVTPGPSIKPTVDHLLEGTINSQRNINSQAKPVLLPNNRPSLG